MTDTYASACHVGNRCENRATNVSPEIACYRLLRPPSSHGGAVKIAGLVATIVETHHLHRHPACLEPILTI